MLIPSSRYPSQTDAPGASYPHGQARNATTFQDGTGTPLEKDWVNDLWGFLQALVGLAGITPSGDPETAEVSDALDSVVAIATTIARRELASVALHLRRTADEAVYADATDANLAAISGLSSSTPARLATIVIKSGVGGCKLVWDGPDSDTLGAVASILDAVTGVARNAGRLLAIGAGGNRCCFSTNEGSSWSAGSDLGATPRDIIYNATFSRFMVTFSAGVNVAHDIDGASTWTSVSTGLTSAQGGIAMLSGGNVVAAGLDGSGDVDIARSTDGGATWSIAGGTVPNAGDYDSAGNVAGNGGAVVWHAGRTGGGVELRLCSSTDGLAWTLTSTITPTFVATNSRLIVCQDTGILFLVVLATLNGSGDGPAAVYASRDSGATWSSPSYSRGFALARGYAAANGRLFASFGLHLSASDRLAF